MKLTPAERLILLNQYRILAALEADERDHATAQDVLHSGYELEYDQLSGLHAGEEDSTLSADDCRMVIDVMDMYGALQQSCEALPDSSGIEESRLIFPGFDGNNETLHMAYARFVHDRQGRFGRLNHRPDFNSHRPMVATYSRMLELWHAIDQRYDLTEEDIVRILGR